MNVGINYQNNWKSKKNEIQFHPIHLAVTFADIEKDFQTNLSFDNATVFWSFQSPSAVNGVIQICTHSFNAWYVSILLWWHNIFSFFNFRMMSNFTIRLDLFDWLWLSLKIETLHKMQRVTTYYYIFLFHLGQRGCSKVCLVMATNTTRPTVAHNQAK